MEDVGRYRVTRRLGQGGMAEVFEGIALGQEGFQRRVAVKRMRAENAAEPAFGRMFLDEAVIASQLHHANIVAVLDFGVADGYPFQVLEFVDGVDLARLVEMGREAGTPLPATMALAICTDIAHALDHAHSARDPEGRLLGIVHRDVSPGNILVSWGGDIKLTDFGIAFARGRAVTTSAGATKGTFLYMAPEQVMRGEIDGRTDLFALGCVLHMLLAGRSPLAAENAMADLIAGQPLPISRDLPDDIYDIVARATRLARRDRYATAGEMASALGASLARRIDRDARTLVQEWLGRLREPVKPPAAGKLDALLGLDLVFSGQRKSLPPISRQTPPPPSEDDLSVDRPRRRASAWFLVAVTAPVVAAGVVVAAWRGDGRGVAQVTEVDGGIVPPEPEIDAAMLVPPPPPSPSPDAQPLLADASPPMPQPPRRDPPPRRPPPGPPERPPPASPPRPAPEAEVTGVLAIGGSGALRAEILVDGRSRGHAPRALTLPAGPHQLELVLPDGHRLGPRTMTVEGHHTPSAPLRWVVPER